MVKPCSYTTSMSYYGHVSPICETACRMAVGWLSGVVGRTRTRDSMGTITNTNLTMHRAATPRVPSNYPELWVRCFGCGTTSETPNRFVVKGMPIASESFGWLNSVYRHHNLALCSSRAPRARNYALGGRRVNGGRRLSRPDVWFHVKDVSNSRVFQGSLSPNLS